MTADPEKRVYTDLTVIVERNTNEPEFAEDTVREEILYSVPLGTVVAQVSATDDDEVRNTYRFDHLFWL